MLPYFLQLILSVVVTVQIELNQDGLIHRIISVVLSFIIQVPKNALDKIPKVLRRRIREGLDQQENLIVIIQEGLVCCYIFRQTPGQIYQRLCIVVTNICTIHGGAMKWLSKVWYKIGLKNDEITVQEYTQGINC